LTLVFLFQAAPAPIQQEYQLPSPVHTQQQAPAYQQQQQAAPTYQQQAAMQTSLSGGGGGGVRTAQRAPSQGGSQNVGNTIGDTPSVKLHAPPGGVSSISFG